MPYINLKMKQKAQQYREASKIDLFYEGTIPNWRQIRYEFRIFYKSLNDFEFDSGYNS